MNQMRTARLAMLVATIVATAIVLAACGSSSNTSTSSASAGSGASGAAGGANSATRTKFAACLKAHGVTLPSRPAGQRPKGNGQGGPPPGGGYGFGGGGGFFGGGGGNARPGGPGGQFNNPKFRAALQACGGGRFTQRRFTLNKAAVTKFVACVKQHGYNLPAPNFSGKGSIFPANIAKDKKFQAASRACASDLRPAGGAGGPPPGGAPPGGGASGSSAGSGSSSD